MKIQTVYIFIIEHKVTIFAQAPSFLKIDFEDLSDSEAIFFQL
jgi:hypothetical protein